MFNRSGSRPAATSKMECFAIIVNGWECFAIIVNGWKPLTIITKHSTLDVAATVDPPLKFTADMVSCELCLRLYRS